MKLPVSRSSSPVMVAAGVLDWVSFSPGSAASSGHRRARGRGSLRSPPPGRVRGLKESHFSVTARHDRGFPEVRFAFGSRVARAAWVLGLSSEGRPPVPLCAVTGEAAALGAVPGLRWSASSTS